MDLPIILVAIVALFVGGILWGHFYFQRAELHALEVLAKSHCASCSTSYGTDAAEQARQEYRARYREMVRQVRRRDPTAFISFTRNGKIRCAQCSAEARFHFQTGSLVTRE